MAQNVTKPPPSPHSATFWLAKNVAATRLCLPPQFHAHNTIPKTTLAHPSLAPNAVPTWTAPFPPPSPT
ncbi:hypothetical protein PIB30_097867, partial [Stylosanthes scabra]|nr:hypothetical protein [Stylosanthes scabra]